MLPQFVNRVKELEFLESVYRDRGFKLVVIYGRRRIGKTELIKKFMEGKKGAYVLLTNESIRENIKYLKEEISRALDVEYYKKLDVDNFYDFFRYLELDQDNFVLALDEFPYLMEIDKSVLSVFQKIIDEILSKKNMMLILLGSSLSMMENDVLGYRSPLYGRMVYTWKLQPFQFKSIYRMFGDMNKAIEAFFVFGDVPYYLSFYDPEKSIEENVKDKILTKGKILYNEPFILLREEFRESRIYRLVLKYISQGYRSLGKLCSVTGLDKSNVSKYLDTLKETGLVEHIIPFGKRRGGIYEIVDPFMDFWFRYVYSHRSELELGNVEHVLDIFKREKDMYFGHKFERLILSILRSGTIPKFRGYGEFTRWWYKGEEIDIVGRNKKTLLVAECKWNEQVDGEKVLESLRDRAGHIGWNGKFEYAIFARSFKTRPENAISYDLRDLESLLT